METIKEHLSPAQFAKVTGILGSDPAGQEITTGWTGKENLRYALNCAPVAICRGAKLACGSPLRCPADQSVMSRDRSGRGRHPGRKGYCPMRLISTQPVSAVPDCFR
jgi:hypothetical protein